MNLKNLHFGWLKHKYQELPEILRSLVILALLLTVVLVVKMIMQPKTPEPVRRIDPNIGTIIPAGHVLVPVEITNIEAIAPLMGTKGVVDLYKFNEKGISRKIAQRVKVLKAPNNPNVYAALLKEEESDLLMATPGPFYAAIQNEKVTGSRLEKASVKNKISISYAP